MTLEVAKSLLLRCFLRRAQSVERSRAMYYIMYLILIPTVHTVHTHIICTYVPTYAHTQIIGQYQYQYCLAQLLSYCFLCLLLYMHTYYLHSTYSIDHRSIDPIMMICTLYACASCVVAILLLYTLGRMAVLSIQNLEWMAV